MVKAKRTSQPNDEPDNSVFQLDENNLVEEWVRQPKLYFDWAVKLADARVEFDQAKAAIDVVTAEIDTDIRSNPDEYGIDKVTEGSIKNLIPIQKEYQAAVDKMIKARHKVDVIQAYVTALEHRKRALEKLVDLHGQNYFATPHSSNQDLNDKAEQSRAQRVADKVKRRARQQREDDEE